MQASKTMKATITEYDAGEGYTASILDYGNKVEFWLGKGITKQLFWTAEGSIDRDVFLKVIEKSLPDFKKSYPLVDREECLFGDTEGERAFPIRKVE